MCRPDLRFGRRSAAPRRQNGAGLGVIFGLHEQFGKGQVRRVGCRRSQRELGVGGELDVPDPVARIRYGQAANFGVVFRRNHDFKHRRDRSIAPRELGSVLAEPDIVAVRFDAARLVARGPHVAAADIAQKDVGAPVVAGGVFAPARDRQITPSTVAGAGSREHHRVPAVGEQLDLRCRGVRGAQAAHRREFVQAADCGTPP